MTTTGFEEKFEFGLLGKTLGHSHSPKLHKALADYNYELIEKTEEDLIEFMNNKNFKGLNVTIPYKERVIAYMDGISDLAQEIGAINTIVNNDGRLLGYNTDYFGFKFMCERQSIEFKDKTVLVLGSGGSSKMVQTYLKHQKAKKIVVISRTGENNYDNLEKWCDAECIVNTTPVGMNPNNKNMPIDLAIFNKLEVVVDIIYNPLRTRLIVESKIKGIKTVTGLAMLVGQAWKASELFTGTKIEAARVEKVLTNLEKSLENIVFIGMPGVGKSTLGEYISKELDREFINIDEEIVKMEKTSIPEIFDKKGETYFRDCEEQLTFKASIKQGVVIATGGGTILREENCKALLQNGKIIYLTRSLEELSRKDRPLSKDIKAIEKLFKQRESRYKELSDIEVPVKEEVNETIKTIKEAIV